MGWLKSLLSRETRGAPSLAAADAPAAPAPSAIAPPGELPRVMFVGDESYEFEIVGESRYQDWLEQVAGPKCEEGCEKTVPVELRPEPGNPHDSNAVQVLIVGRPVGYIARPAAAVLSPMLKAGGVPPLKAEVLGMVVGGWSRRGSEGSFGVKLDMLWPPQAFVLAPGQPPRPL